MKWYVMLFRILYYFYLALLVSAIGCLMFNYRGSYTGTSEQVYYMHDKSMDDFFKSYKAMLISKGQKDHFLFQEPYHGKYVVKRFWEMENRDEASCDYFIPSINGMVQFRVIDGTPLRIELLKCVPSFDPQRELHSDPAFNINGRDVSFIENRNVISAFEKNILDNIGNYQKDVIQGFIRQYTSFFERNFLHIAISFIVLTSIYFYLLSRENNFHNNTKHHIKRRLR